MDSSYQPGRTSWFLIVLAAVVITLAGIKIAETIIAPFLIALFITAICGPLMFWLTRHKIPPVIAVTIIVLFLVFSGFFITSLVSSSVQSFSQNIPQYQERLQEINVTLLGLLNKIGIHMQLDEFLNTLNLGKVMRFVGTTFNQVLGALANTFLILMVVIFLLLELHSFRSKVEQISKQPVAALQRMEKFSRTLNRYFLIKTLTSLMTAIPVAVVLSIMDIDFPILWGLLTFILNFIPNIGSIIAAIPAVLLALIQYGFIMAAEVALLYLVVNNIIGNFVEPRMLGRSLGLSTLVVFLSLVFWGWLLGPVGMFLSVPLTMTLKIAMENTVATHWVAVLLGNDDH